MQFICCVVAQSDERMQTEVRDGVQDTRKAPNIWFTGEKNW